ncbi:hypothetical protein BKA58DRAFT_171184 [Alternaria rosae]|uniref:uncharacterized protein n=1 Tax=Alternaria rosae TaxID=1187941 RepID=UPI001E8EDCEC|nr:uncharacterized protein BKA58DRAFT_171184 [Alternaria rosae]KAH6870089.1 hypothetical protein BKA58DRAFT_171184 [Alternaria rosae]
MTKANIMEQTLGKPAPTVYPWINTDNVTGDVKKSFAFVYGRLKFQAGRVDDLEAQMKHLKQFVGDAKTKFEADIEGLQSDIGDLKAQNQQLRNELDAERARNQRLETTLEDSRKSISRIGQQLNDLSNKFDGHMTIAFAHFKRTDRVVPDFLQRIEWLDRSSNTYSQSIAELREDLEDRFETVVIHNQDGLRHNRTAWIEGLEKLRIETAEKLDTATNHFSTAVESVQAKTLEHTKTFNKTALVLDRNSKRIEELEVAKASTHALERMNQRVEQLESATGSHDVTFQASQGIDTRLDSLDARLSASEVAHSSIRAPSLTPPTTTTAASDLNDLRNKVDAIDLHMKNELASFGNCKDRLAALE